jgi:hypothetical protein
LLLKTAGIWRLARLASFEQAGGKKRQQGCWRYMNPMNGADSNRD